MAAGRAAAVAAACDAPGAGTCDGVTVVGGSGIGDARAGAMPRRGPAAGAGAADGGGGRRRPARSATGRQSSIGPMTESPGEEARFLTRNAVDALPEGALEQQLAEGEPAAREARDRPHRAGHPPRPHRGPAQAARVPGPRPHGGADRRRLHRARGGPQRPLVHPARSSSGEEIDANAETFQEQAFTVLDRERTEVRRNGEWLDMPMEDLFRLARTSTVAQLLERDDFAKRYAAARADLDPRAALPAAPGLRLGGGRRRRRARRHRPEVQPPARARHPAGLRPAAPVDPHHADPARAPTACSGCPSRWATTSGSPSPPEEIFGKLMRVPDAAMPVYYELLLDEPFDPARPAVESKRRDGAGARRALPRRGRRARRPRRTSTACTWRARLPDEIEELRRRAPTTARCTCRRCCATRSGSRRSEARRLLAQGGVRLDGEPLGADELDLPADRLDGAVLQVGKRRFRRLTDRLRSGLPSAAAALYCPVPATGDETYSLGASRLREALFHAGTSCPRRNPRPEGAAVFENSAACATDELFGACQSRPGSTSGRAFGGASEGLTE